jgi:ABC-type dipeptide/oligopeptide/nickel transport system permease subunit
LRHHHCRRRRLVALFSYADALPHLTIGLTLLSFNVLGDALRDAVDPFLQRSR